jgi:hypothetical protein
VRSTRLPTPSKLLFSLVVAGITAAGGGCAGAQPATSDGDDLEAVFYLASIDGAPLPHPLPPDGECGREIVAGELRLEGGSSFRLQRVHDVRCPGRFSAIGHSASGRFARTGSSLRLEPEHGEALTAHVSDTLVTVGSEQFVRVGYGPGPRDLAVPETERMERYLDKMHAEAFPSAYRCEADGALDGAPPLPPADTAGLGGRIDQHFPGWRLSTEREIACRFPLLDGATPAMYEGDRWGSGRAWWVLEGDFNGDGTMDRAAVLTSRDEPTRDLLVVLFSDGTAAEVASPDGWGVRIASGRGETVPVDGIIVAARRRADALTIVYWEKAAETYTWMGGRFIAVSGTH